MTGIEKVLLALGVAAVGAAGVGIGLAASKSSTPSPAPSPSPSPAPPATGGGGLLWVRATTINPNDRVRVSVAASDLQTLAQSLGVAVPAASDWAGMGALWQQVLASSQLQSVIEATGGVQAWWPSPPTQTNTSGMAPSALPTDWPTDDPAESSEYHAQFTYGGAAPVTVASLPIPVLAWVAKGTGA